VLRLDAGGGVGQSAAGTITAATLTGRSGGATTLTAAPNAITELAGFNANGLRLRDVGGLTVVGAVTGGAAGVALETSGDLAVNAAVSAVNGPITLTATGAGGDVALAAPVNAGTGAVTLTANGTGGTITQTAAGGITAGRLTGGSSGATTLTGGLPAEAGPTLPASPNRIARLGAFSAEGFTLYNGDGGLTLDGPVNGGSGSVIVTTFGALTTEATGTVVAGSDIALLAGGDLTAPRSLSGVDVALMSVLGRVDAGTITARDDIAIRAGGTVTTGALTSGAAPRADLPGVADALLGFTLGGADIDIAGNGVSTGALRAIGPGSDIRVVSGGGTIGSDETDLDMDADGDLALAGAARGRDIALRAGGDLAANALTAQDDVALRAGGAITVAGAIASGAGNPDVDGAADRLAAADGRTTAGRLFDLVGRDVDVIAGGAVRIAGPITAQDAAGATSIRSDVRIGSTGASVTLDGATPVDVTADRDILIEAATTVRAPGRLFARGRDVGVRAGGTATLGSAEARDDVVLRAGGDLGVAGTLTAGGGAEGAGTDQAGDLLFALAPTALDPAAPAPDAGFTLAGGNIDARSSTGAITVGGAATASADARFQAPVGVVTTSGRVEAREGDILADGDSVLARADLTAGRDIALRGRTGEVRLEAATSAGPAVSARAGDDVAIRALGGPVKVTGRNHERRGRGPHRRRRPAARLCWTDRRFGDDLRPDRSRGRRCRRGLDRRRWGDPGGWRRIGRAVAGDGRGGHRRDQRGARRADRRRDDDGGRKRRRGSARRGAGRGRAVGRDGDDRLGSGRETTSCCGRPAICG
jgi:hypothetical protein